MAVISEDSIKRFIVPHLSIGKRGSKLKVEPATIMAASIYRLKTGCQWRELPLKELLNGHISWQGVYHHFRKWACDGSLTRAWVALLKSQRRLLDLSSVQLDGSQTIRQKGKHWLSTQESR